MSKNSGSTYDRPAYNLYDKLSSKFAFKGSSNSRRIHTEPYDPLDDDGKTSAPKLQFSITNNKNYLPSKSTKKTNPPSLLYDNKPTQLSNQRLTTDYPLNQWKNTASKYSKDVGDMIKTSTGNGKGVVSKVEDYKKHLRIKTEATEEKANDRVSQIYQKLSNISAIKEKPVVKDPERNYKIEEVIGKGTFGVVYKAISLVTGDPVAIKRVLQDKRYKNRQLQILRMLHHPNLLQIQDYFYTKQSNQEYLNVVMDYYQETLYNFTKVYSRKSQQIPQHLIKVYAFQMFKAINYLRAISIAHRDIKPHNILINPQNNKLVICDFGSAKQLVQTEANLAYICSRCYRAPELIFGATDYTTQIDVWSIGCVIVEMVNGEPPFLGDSQIDQLIEIIKVLGTPSKLTVLEMNKNYDMKDYKFPQVNGREWRKVLKSKTDVMLVDLISKVMEYSPFKRLTPFEAMCHPYFDDLRDEQKYRQLTAMTCCNDLLEFNKDEALVDKKFINHLLPSWYSSR